MITSAPSGRHRRVAVTASAHDRDMAVGGRGSRVTGDHELAGIRRPQAGGHHARVAVEAERRPPPARSVTLCDTARS